MQTADMMLSVTSIIIMRNRTGPKTNPWGTVDKTRTGSEACLLNAPREPQVDRQMGEPFIP